MNFVLEYTPMLLSPLNIAQPASPIFLQLFRSVNCYGSFSKSGLDTGHLSDPVMSTGSLNIRKLGRGSDGATGRPQTSECLLFTVNCLLHSAIIYRVKVDPHHHHHHHHHRVFSQQPDNFLTVMSNNAVTNLKMGSCLYKAAFLGARNVWHY